jgi:hypothetical protein
VVAVGLCEPPVEPGQRVLGGSEGLSVRTRE